MDGAIDLFNRKIEAHEVMINGGRGRVFHHTESSISPMKARMVLD